MNLFKLNKVLHRDLGYLFAGMIIIYAISGIAVNHRQDWNPNYIINKQEFKYNKPVQKENINNEIIMDILKIAGEDSNYKNHYFPDDVSLRIFVDGGNVLMDLQTGDCILETNRKRALFYQVNFLHYNPGRIWTWFSDFFCVVLVFLSIGGLFILKGKNGLKWRGAILSTIGVIVPVIFLLYYL